MYEEQGSFFEEDYNGHVERFEEMLKKNESYFFDVDVFEYLAEHYLEDGNLRLALKALEIGISQHPSSAIIILRKAQLHTSTGRIRSGHELLNHAEALDPENDEIYLTRASLFSQEHKHEEAIKNYLIAIDLADPESLDELYLDLAFEYENIENYDQAIKALKNALIINPDNEGSLYEIGYCYEQGNKLEACVSFCKEFLDNHPYSFTAWYIMGNAFSRMEKYDQAITSYDYCVIIKEGFSSAYFNQANCHVQLEEYDAAVSLYLKTFDYETPQAITHVYIAECFEKLNNNEKALTHYNKAIELDAELSDAWFGKAIVKDRMEKTTESVDLLLNAIQLDEKNAEYWHVLGEAFEKLDRYDEALNCYQKVVDIEPENIDAWLDLSNVLTEIDSIEKATEVIHRALSINKNNEELMYRLVAYLLQVGNDKKAQDQLQAALTKNYDAHEKLFNYFPEAKNFNEVLKLIESFKN